MTGVQTCALPICFPVTILGVSGDQGVVGKIGQIRDIPPQIFEVSGKQVGSVPSTSGNILLVDTPLGKKAFTADVSYYATKTKPFADAELILGSAKMQRVGIDVSTPVPYSRLEAESPNANPVSLICLPTTVTSLVRGLLALTNSGNSILPKSNTLALPVNPVSIVPT